MGAQPCGSVPYRSQPAQQGEIFLLFLKSMSTRSPLSPCELLRAQHCQEVQLFELEVHCFLSRGIYGINIPISPNEELFPEMECAVLEC